MKNIYIVLLSLFCGSLLAQYPNPNDFNTASDGSGGQLPYLGTDQNWQVALGPVGSTTLPSDLSYGPAIISGGCAPGNWYDPATDVINGGTIFTNSTWISLDFGNSNPCDQTGNNIDLFYRIQFDLPSVGPCGSPIANGFCYAMDFLADNQVYQLYVNGNPQLLNPSPSYGFTGFAYGNRQQGELCSDWQPGNNELVIHIKSGGCCSGFLSQARFPDLPSDSETPICISKESIDVVLEAPDFAVTLSPDDLDFGSYSPCNQLDLGISNSVFGCEDIGENISTLLIGSGDNQTSCQTIVNVVEGDEPCPEDPCNDLSASLIPNPDFEEAVSGCNIITQAQLNCSVSWEQATQATSDLYDTSEFPDLRDLNQNFWTNPTPPSGNRFVGMYRTTNEFASESSTLAACLGDEEYVEYVGSELLSPIIQNEIYTLNVGIGSPNTDDNFTEDRIPSILNADLVVLGLPNNTNFPISGCDCKEDNFEVIGKSSFSLQAGTWDNVNVMINALDQDYNYIMFGLSCERPLEGFLNYLLVDNINLVPGVLNCPSDCYSITGDAPPCNSDIDTESESTYTYDFTFINETDSTFSQILLFDADESFDIDAGTLLDLGTTLAPGQSVDLSWDINANNYEAETYMYCFDIAPYNHGGVCCKAQHCVELESCCTDIPGNTKNMIDRETECCYAYGYDSCIPDFYVSITFDMLTEGLSLSVSSVMDGFQVSGQEGGPLMLTRLDGGFFPEGTLENVLEFCVDGMGSESPEMQELSMTWGAIEGDGVVLLEAELCTLECPIPPDECAELIDPVVYCDDNFVYHYQFSVKNINARMLEASIVVLGPVEDSGTVPGDFSQSTFPDFPDHTPNGDPYLEYNETTEVYDITLPNASLGSSYEFIISLHDYRNINAEDGEYWCCYTPVSFTIDVTVPCGGAPEINTGMEYIVYPNPLEDAFVMKFDQAVEDNTTLIISDLNGNIVKSESLRSKINTHRMEVSDLNTGIYYISVYNDAGLGYHQRFVKR